MSAFWMLVLLSGVNRGNSLEERYIVPHYPDVYPLNNIFCCNINAKYRLLEFLEPKTFINELRSIWNLVFEVETLQHRFFNRMMKEWDFLKNREAALDSGAGTSYQQEEEYQNKKKEFKCFLSSIKAQYNIIHRNYQDFIKKFLLDLSVQKDHELRLLSSRIDYNEHYKRIDSRLNESMKFSRCSDLMFY